MPETEVVSEIERYRGGAGQACAYKVGQLKILELRDKANTRLGPRFNLKDFHTVVLENGGLPLFLLEQLDDEWIGTGQSQLHHSNGVRKQDRAIVTDHHALFPFGPRSAHHGP